MGPVDYDTSRVYSGVVEGKKNFIYFNFHCSISIIYLPEQITSIHEKNANKINSL